MLLFCQQINDFPFHFSFEIFLVTFPTCKLPRSPIGQVPTLELTGAPPVRVVIPLSLHLPYSAYRGHHSFTYFYHVYTTNLNHTTPDAPFPPFITKKVTKHAKNCNKSSNLETRLLNIFHNKFDIGMLPNLKNLKYLSI